MADFLKLRIDNRYEIQERIGAGGMARVFKAWDCNLERPVAVKILHEHLVDEPTFKDRFAREAKLIASLNHPNIVQVYDYNFFERDGIPVYFMIMPYLEGLTLRELIDRHLRNKSTVPRAQVMQITHDLCEALGYAHEHGMVHRDVKPGNVILNEAGRAILTDFGIARMVQADRVTQDSVTTGTPAYMSPEQVQGEGGDARSDLYSLGVMLFEMVTGHPPYTDEGGLSLVLKHLNAPIPTVSSTLGTDEPELDALIQRALAKAPEDRFQTAQEFAAALRQIPLSGQQATTVGSLPLQIPPIKTSATQTPASPPSQPNIVTSLRWLVPAVVLGTIIVFIGILTQSPSTANDPRLDPEQIPRIESPTTLNEEAFTSNFDPDEPDNILWPPSVPGIVTRELLPEGILRITNQQPGTADTTLVMSEHPYGNVTISMQATLDAESAEASGYGVVFRFQDESNYNVFAVNGRGRFSIWVRQDGIWRELREAEQQWSENEAVATIGSPNRLRINIIDQTLTAYVNNRPVARVQDETFVYGRLGIYVAAPEDGIAIVNVDTYEVYPIVPAMTER